MPDAVPVAGVQPVEGSRLEAILCGPRTLTLLVIIGLVLRLVAWTANTSFWLD